MQEPHAGSSFDSSKTVKNIVKNTILTDLLKTMDDVQKSGKGAKLPKGTIKKFKGYKITAEKDPLSYMVSPYLSMSKRDSLIPTGDHNIAVDRSDTVLRSAKGYYGSVGTKGRSHVILGSNIRPFRNDHAISDLLKMDLSIYAIKVGRTSIANLNGDKDREWIYPLFLGMIPIMKGSKEDRAHRRAVRCEL